MKTLSQWDIKLIKLFKSCKIISVHDVKKIWAERCNLDIEYVRTEDIVEHLFNLIIEFNLLDKHGLFNLIENAESSQHWRFGLLRNKLNYWDNWLAVLDSFFCLTKVNKLPGYV